MKTGKTFSKEEALERILKGFRSNYNIHRPEPVHEHERKDETLAGLGAAARCDYFEEQSQYVLSRKAELWSAKGEEFLYLIPAGHLNTGIFEQVKERIRVDAMGRLHIGPGHMYSYVTLVFLCDTSDEEAVKALKKCRIYKSFRFSLHGWMDFRTVLVNLETGTISCNNSGRPVAKILKRILYEGK